MKSPLFKSLIFAGLIALLAIQNNHAQQGNITINQDDDIATLLEAKKELNKDSDDYYKIQIYSGNRTSAEAARANFNTSFVNWPAKMVYETPNFKIWAGNFRTRLEADRALNAIKKDFPGAFIFKPKK